MSETSQQPSKAGEKDPIKELLERMNQVRGLVAGSDPRLSETIEALRKAAEQPGKTAEEEFRTRVAYAVQDLGRLAGPFAFVPGPLRRELNELALAAPGLQNARLGEMLRETPGINDRQLVRDIRQAAFEAIRSADQNGPDITKRVQDIEARLRQATAPAQSETRQAERPSPGTHAGLGDRTHAAVSPGEGNRLAGVGEALPSRGVANAAAGQQQPAGALVRGPGLLDRLAGVMAAPASDRPRAPEETPTPLADRIVSFTRNHMERRSLEAAEASGQRAVEALQRFESGPGAAVMTKIREAAQTDPRGIQGVLSEMREGGRHAELRTQFNNALQQERGGLAAAYDTAAGAVRQYGADRQAAEAVILRRANDPVLAARFERLDAQIGEATSRLPGRQDGRSMTDELGQKIAELARRAAEAVRSVFSREPRASAGPSPGP
ncbi:hypothetical protein GXW71_30165 [Roseomonas hellenica]|uniref:Uncharacterized protein n=1 Tax=Plastoroseomonas hellenica TaxID=2687306 RepID=A0ABS5F959_9PROT|nr:hypothetical protein [Plastoroseomonas hellenica]MBR0668655.1 hypothetical protein [Plastoroseomonas hellenica]